MVEDDRYCIDVLHQLAAVQGALDRAVGTSWGPICADGPPTPVVEGEVYHTVYELMAATFGVATGSRPEHHYQHAEVTPSVAATVS